MVNASDFLPVGYLAGIYLPHLVRSQVLDRILGIDDKHQCIDSKRRRFQFDTQTFLQAASALAIAPKTVEKYITAWCKGGQLVRIAQGKYEKA